MRELISGSEYGLNKVILHDTEIFEQEASLAAEMIERWGMIAAMPDGEDSAGRSKLRLATPEELVGRALDCARLFMEKARANGLVTAVPGYKELFPPKETQQKLSPEKGT
jgi:hypothetical protein